MIHLKLHFFLFLHQHSCVQEWHNVTIEEEQERAVMAFLGRMEVEEETAKEVTVARAGDEGEQQVAVERMEEEEKWAMGLAMEGEEVQFVSDNHDARTPDSDEEEDHFDLVIEDLSEGDDIQEEKDSELKETRKKYSCEVEGCSKKFISSQHLSNHMRAGHGAPKLECEIPGCNFTFNSYNNLKSHRRVHHNGEQMKCRVPECTKTFNSFNNLGYHMRKCHGAPDLRCSSHFCTFTTIHYKQLNNHKRKYHGAPKLQCQVPNCPATFNNYSNRQAHILKEHSVGS